MAYGNVRLLSVNVSYLTVDVGCLTVNVRCLAVDVRCLTVNVGCLTVNVGSRAVNVGSRAVNVRSRAVNVRSRAVNVSSRAVPAVQVADLAAVRLNQPFRTSRSPRKRYFAVCVNALSALCISCKLNPSPSHQNINECSYQTRILITLLC